ncbi:galaxin-like isoform X2 [Ctenopharyngodon idella]|uniref:galaxin-like isoform X2 n=1 Tax=Ctenopharyngodon idella TaxID=7959 RepID=UPI00222F3A1B|nr:galaxin-like isoform X2 [Ctenopharyngodon idella]
MEVYASTACLTILCFFATFFAQGICVHDKRSHNTDFNGHMAKSHHLQCGNESYVSSRSSCCNGHVTNGLSQLVADCCGSKAYNSLNEICCDGSLFTRSSAQVQCCGKVMYLPMTHLCCVENNVTERKENHGCCGKESFDMTTHICCSNTLTVKLKNESSSDSPRTYMGSSPGTRPLPKVPEFKCGSETYNPQEEICCSGNSYKASALTMCCGESIYTPFDENVLCCNGTLHLNVPKQSECVGDVVYTNSTCHLSARPRLGEHCCGGQAFEPHTHICCNGHSHNKKYGNFCCGSDVYNPHNESMGCCSGHLYNKSEKECCGNLLLEHNSNKICCSSSTHAMLYDTKPNHFCCGHYYYNASLWSCCAEHLKPTPSHNSVHAEYRLKPLTDLIPDICKKTVLFGKVESVALDKQHRLVVLKVVNVFKDSWHNESLDHCRTPALENGMTYLWENTNNGYKPVSIPVEKISDIHMFYTVCHQHKCQKEG